MSLAGIKINNHNNIEVLKTIGWFISKKKKKDYGNRIIREKTISYLKKRCSHRKKEHRKNKWKNKRKNKRKRKRKWIINILSALKHHIAISQPFRIVSFICYMAVKLQKNAPNQ